MFVYDISMIFRKAIILNFHRSEKPNTLFKILRYMFISFFKSINYNALLS